MRQSFDAPSIFFVPSRPPTVGRWPMQRSMFMRMIHQSWDKKLLLPWIKVLKCTNKSLRYREKILFRGLWIFVQRHGTNIQSLWTNIQRLWTNVQSPRNDFLSWWSNFFSLLSLLFCAYKTSFIVCHTSSNTSVQRLITCCCRWLNCVWTMFNHSLMGI